MSRPPRNPPEGKGRKVIPFPVPLSGESLVDSAGRFGEDIEEAWSEELERLTAEPETNPIRLQLDTSSGAAFLEFLKTTGLERFIRIVKEQGSIALFSGKPTVNRLVVWQALDLGLDFSVSART